MSKKQKKRTIRPRADQLIHIQLPETEVRRRIRRGFWWGVLVGMSMVSFVVVFGYLILH